MPTFNFKGPDGKSYSVNGPDGATPEQAFEMLQTQLGIATPAPAEPIKKAPTVATQPAAPPAMKSEGSGDGGFLDEASTAVRGVGTGLGRTVLGAQRLLGKWYGFLGDKASGAPSPSLSDLVAGQKPQSNNPLTRVGNWLANDAETGRARMAGELAPYKARNPLSALAGETVGEIAATAPIGAGALGGGARLLQVAGMAPKAGTVLGTGARAAQAATVGAATGGAMGAANSKEDTLGGIAGDAAQSAAMSAVLGGVLSPVTGGLGAVINNVKQRASKTSAADFAKQKIAEAFARDAKGDAYTSGMLNPLQQIAKRFTKLGPEAAMVDAGRTNTMQLLDTLATLPGRTKDAAANFQRARMTGEGVRMRDAAERALDTQGQRLPSTIDALLARRQRDSGPLYNELRQIDIKPSQELADLMKNANELGVTKLGKEIATARQMPFTLDKAPPDKWNMGDLDHVKQGIDQVLSSRKAMNVDGTLTPLGHSYSELKNKMVGMLDAATVNPSTGQSLYASARQAFAEPSRLMDAGRAGQRAIAQDENSIKVVMRGMDPNELQAFRIGAFEGLRGKLGTQGGRTEILNMYKNPSTQERLRAVFGSDRAYREFASDVLREEKLRAVQTVGRGSQTAARLAGMGDLDKSAMPELAAAAGAAKAGNPLAALGSVKNAWNRVAVPESVRNQMGQMLLSRGPDAQREMNALAALVQNINNRNLQLSTRVGQLGGATGANAFMPTVPTQIPQKR